MLQRKVSLFGFHLAPIDLRQSSGEHERAVAELLAKRRRVRGLRRSWTRARGRRSWSKELAGPRPLRVPHLEYSQFLRERARDRRRRGRGPAALRRARGAALRDLALLGGVGPARGRRAAARSRAARAGRHHSAVRVDRRPGPLRRSARRGARPAALQGMDRGARRRAGSDARLLRQQQGRRLLHLELVAVQGRGRRWSRCAASAACACACSTAAAAPSAAAAARATTRCWRSRRARSTARCASPSRAR